MFVCIRFEDERSPLIKKVKNKKEAEDFFKMMSKKYKLSELGWSKSGQGIIYKASEKKSLGNFKLPDHKKYIWE